MVLLCTTDTGRQWNGKTTGREDNGTGREGPDGAQTILCKVGKVMLTGREMEMVDEGGVKVVGVTTMNSDG